jgi:hypothetical protein
MKVLLTSSYFIIIIVILLIQFQQDVNGLKYNFKIKANKVSPSDNSANQQNPNKGTSGTNKVYDQAIGNRGTQQNSNKKGGGGGGKSGVGKWKRRLLIN